MLNLTLKEIAAAVDGVLSPSADASAVIRNLEFDSRKIGPDDIFLPLAGSRDGHDFIPVAYKNGASAVFTERVSSDDLPWIRVRSCQIALEQLAAYLLRVRRPDVIAITGSNGKTTTKDLTAAVLATTFKTYKTQGNHNNEIGLPYTVCQAPADTEKLVLEMGMDRPGDIDKLSSLANPVMAAITLIGESHLEFFGNRREIARGKMGMTTGLTADNPLIAPADRIIDEFIPENQRIVRFGDGAEIRITELDETRDHLTFKVNFLDLPLTVPVPGKFNATNAMIAAYIGHLQGVSDENIASALASAHLTGNRTEWKTASNGASLLADCYNANPTSMRLILETFQNLPSADGGRKIAVLADMLELGSASGEMHAAMSDVISLDKLDEIYLYGPEMKFLSDELPSARYFTDLDHLTAAVTADVKPNDTVLFKGSNGMQLTQVIEALQES